MNALSIVVTVLVAAFIGRVVTRRLMGDVAGYAMVAAVLGALLMEQYVPLWPRPLGWNGLSVVIGAAVGAYVTAVLARGTSKGG